MITLERSVLIDAPFDRVWDALRQPDQVAECIPGMQLEGRSDNGAYLGRFSVSFGPTRVTFAGEADIEIDESAHGGVITAKGADKGGRTRARGTSRFQLSASGEGSMLDTQVSFEISGPLAGFARTGGAQIMGRLTDEMAKNIASHVGAAAPPQRVGETAPADGFLARLRSRGSRLLQWARNLVRRERTDIAQRRTQKG